jgi:putative O-antigen polymerase
MSQSSTSEKLICLLTTALYACFSIFNTSAWSSLSLLIVTAIVLVLQIHRKGLNGICFTSFHSSVFLFGVFCLLSSLWALNSQEAIEKGTTIMEILVCMSIFFWVYTTLEDGFNKLLKSIMWGGFIISVYAILFYGVGHIMFVIMGGYRLESVFDNVNAIGLLCAFSVILSVYYFIYEKRHWLLLMDIPIIMILAACGSRKAMVILVLGSLAVYMLKADASSIRSLIFRFITTIVLLVVLVLVISQMSIFAGLNERMEGLIALIIGTGEVDHSAMIRQEMANLGYAIFLENPIVGIGMGNAHIIDAQVLGEDCYLHNNFAEVLANGGAIGFWLYYRMFFNSFRLTKNYGGLQEDGGKILVIMLVSIVLADYGLVSYYSKIYYFFLMAFYVYIFQLKKSYYAVE